VLHGWIHTCQCWNYPASHKSSITSTVEFTTSKNCDQYHKLRTTSIQALHIKYSSHKRMMSLLHTRHRIKSVERTCSGSRLRFNRMTTSRDTSTWSTNHKLWVSNNLLSGRIQTMKLSMLTSLLLRIRNSSRLLYNSWRIGLFSWVRTRILLLSRILGSRCSTISSILCCRSRSILSTKGGRIAHLLLNHQHLQNLQTQQQAPTHYTKGNCITQTTTHQT